MRRICILLLAFATIGFGADKKILIRALSGGFAFDDNAIESYKQEAGADADIVVARTAEEFEKAIPRGRTPSLAASARRSFRRPRI